MLYFNIGLIYPEEQSEEGFQGYLGMRPFATLRVNATIC
jgi:hypothetical protein